MRLKRELKRNRNAVMPSQALKDRVLNGVTVGVKVKKRFPLARLAVAAGAVCLVMIVALPLLLSFYPRGGETYTYITVDINPAVELVLGADNEVVKVNAYNREAALLLCGETLNGSAAQQIGRLIELALRCGYVWTGREINILAVAGDRDSEERLSVPLLAAAENALAAAGIEAYVTGVSENSRAAAAKHGMTPARYELVMRAATASGQKFDKLKKKSVDQLYRLASKYDEGSVRRVYDSLGALLQDYRDAYGKEAERQLRLYEELLTILEEIEEADEGAAELIRTYNDMCGSLPELLLDETLRGEELEEEAERLAELIEDLADDLEDEYEDGIDEIKKQYKGVFDDDDDDDDD